MIRVALAIIVAFEIMSTSFAFAEMPTAIRLARAHQYDKVGRLTDLPRFLWTSEECSPPAKLLLQKLLDYHQIAIRSKSAKSHWAKGAKAIYKEITAELTRIEEKSPACFDSVARAYAVGSVAMLESSYDQTLLKLASYFAYDLPGWNRATEYPRVSILTPTRRKDFGCVWTTAGQNYAYKAFGGFFCNTSTIAIDPFLPPANLAASFIHEIDHLLRDKVGRIATSEDEVRELTIYDEALSSTLSAFLQLRLALWPKKFVQNRSWHWSYEMTKRELDQIPARGGYQLDFDNDLFLKNGPVFQISRELESVVLARPPDFLIASDILPCKLPAGPTGSSGFSTWNMSDKKPKAFFKEKTKELWKEIFDRIQRAYFRDYRPMSYLSPAMPLRPNAYYEKNCFLMSPILDFYNNHELSELVLEPSHNVYPILNLINDLLGTPSGSCKVFHRALNKTSEPVEIGEKIQDPEGQSQTDSGPIADYIGNCSSQGGNEVGKTGNEGGKTGNEGGKTSLGTARPCLEIPR